MKRMLLSLVTALVFLLCGGCSSSTKSAKENHVSQYDREFDPPKDSETSREQLPNINQEEEILSRAISAYDRGQYTNAKTAFNELQETFPSSYFAPLAELKLADSAFLLGDVTTAIQTYEEFTRLRPRHEAVPYAQFQIANAYRKQYRSSVHDQAPLRSAIKNYQRLLDEHPKSIYVPLSRRFIDEAREQLAEHELAIADFYYRQGQKKASAARLRNLVQSFSESKIAQDLSISLNQKYSDDPDMLALLSPGSGALFAANPLEPKTAAELAPKAPTVIKLADKRLEPRYQRFRLDAQRKAPQTPEVFEGERPAAAENSFLRSLTCGSEANARIISVYVHDAIKSIETEESLTDSSPSAGRVANVFSNPFTPTSRVTETPTRAEECTTEGLSLTVRESVRHAPDKAQKVLTLQISQAASGKIRIFSLDRPNRIVIVQEKEPI